MAIDVQSWTTDKIVYKVIPEDIPEQTVLDYNAKNKADGDGWTKDRQLRKAGEVPFSFLYNYALNKGIPSTRMWDFFKADNCKEMKRLLNEFDCFRCGSKFIRNNK